MAKKNKKKNGRGSTVLLFFVFFAGLSLLLYPTFADYWNSMFQAQFINRYVEAVEELDDMEYQKIFSRARVYNRNMTNRLNYYVLTEEEQSAYPEILRLSDDSTMGYIEIPSINVTLPIKHGTSEEVLASAVGHLEWTSLPVGGEGTHCVLSGHRGLPGAKLFTNLDKLVEGDVFTLRVLDEVLSYEVDQILTVEPTMVSDLQIEDGRDYCTLVTCTPYGINSHRLLVRGHRTETPRETETLRILSEAVQVEELSVAAFMAVPLLAVSLLILFAAAEIRRRR